MKTFLEIEQQLNMLFLEFKKLRELLTYPEVLLDSKLSVKLQKQQQLLNPIATKFNDYLNLKKSISEFADLQKTLNGNDKNLITSELELSTLQLECLKQELVCMYLNLNAVVQNVVVEIVANKNAESEKLQSTIVSGYTQFCTSNAFSCNVSNLNNVSVLNISGLNALEVFKTEIGMHCNANNSKLIACQVFVYENVVLPNLNFSEADVKISVCRSGGAGGQHVNTTNSMVKATHLPTGINVVCQDERSQFQNKQKALESLKQKVETYYLNQHTKQTEAIKREQAKQIKIIGTIKVYNFSNETITLPNGKTILLSQFLSGKVL